MFPKLKTERLLLRQLTESDDQVILFLRSDQTVNAHVTRTKTNTIEEAISFINKINKGIDEQNWLLWGITIKNNPKLIGTICLWNFSEDRKTAEVGYDLHPEFYKQGIMNEALKNILNYGFEVLKLDTIEAFTHRDNEASKKLLIRNNFYHIEHRKDSNNEDNIIFSIAKERS
jgi:ribosomal-protein-alanine N-acetyltransferase